jgi:hypothetical protein
MKNLSKKSMQEWNEIDSALKKYLQNVIKKNPISL